MVRTVLFVVLGVSGGLALATLFQGNVAEELALPTAPGEAQGARLDSNSSALEERVQRLEGTLQREVASRLLLQQELVAMSEELETLRDESSQRRGRTVEESAGSDPEDMRARFAERFSNGRDTDASQRRLDQLSAAGFSADQSQRIVQRESELRMEALYAQYDATREGEPITPFNNRFNGQDQLRQELGDADYERYLDATGQSTSIGVRQVLASSPGETAGLQPGDEIVAYGGERVFSTSDLNRLTLEGSPGQPVAVDIVRDGQQTQLFLPRGPIGITSGRGPQLGGVGR